MTTKVHPHPYIGDGVRDFNGQDRCAECHLPRDRDVHELPPTEPEVRAVEARRVGDRV